MIIRTDSLRNLEEDMAKFLNMDELQLYDNLLAISRECEDEDEKLDELLESFINKNTTLCQLDEVYIYHLARHFLEPIELYPLRLLLLSHNLFSDFLKERGIEFCDNNNKLVCYYNGEIVSSELIKEKEPHLAYRLGYIEEPDLCINGFAFWVDIENTTFGYFQDLEKGPEILGEFDRFFGMAMQQEYREKTKYYGVVLRVAIEEVIYDGKNYNKEEKILLFMNIALKKLLDCYCGGWRGASNICMRLADDVCAVVDDCILIR